MSPPDLPLAVIDGVNTASPQTYQVHADHLGRPVAMTDASKSIVWSATWTPFGEVQSLTGSAVNNLRFPGQYFLIETGQAYNWRRTYDPVSGRYLQPDPLRFVDGPSLYAYAGNSPVMKTDRFGLSLSPNKYPNSPMPPSAKGVQVCDDCTREWVEAEIICMDELAKPFPNRRITGGHKTLQGCMKGFVSQRCGGNKVQW